MHACIRCGILTTSTSRSCWSRLSHFSTAIRRRYLWVVGGSSRPKTVLFNVSQACSLGFVSEEHAGHSSLAMLSWMNSFTRCARWGRELSSIKTNYFPKFCRYGCTIGRWTVCLRRSVWPDCRQTRLRRLSSWSHIRHLSVNRTWCQFWWVHSACCWAHLYRATWCLGVKCGPRHGRREWSFASCSLFRTVWVETLRPVAARKALFSMVALFAWLLRAEIRK